MKVKRKPIDMRLSSVFRGSHVSGSSETFYGNVLSRAVPPVVESDGQRGSESLATHHSPSPGNDLRIDLQDNTDSCLRLYRRMSGFMGSPLEEEGEEEYGAMDSPNEESSFCENNEIEEIGVYYGSFATSEESVLKFEMLNPTLFLWPSIYSYVESVIHLGEPIETEDWFSLLMHNGNVYITFVNFYHQYVHSVVRGDIPWNQVPGYSDISITIPLMMMECRFQNRSLKEEAYYQFDFQSLDLNPFYSSHCFHLKNVSSDSHPILRSIRILPRFNPHITYPCLLAVFFSSNLLLAKDVTSYLTRGKELLRSLHLADLSYYSNAHQRCLDDSLVCGVIYANACSIDSSPHELHELSYTNSLPVSPIRESSPSSPSPLPKHTKSNSIFGGLWNFIPSLSRVTRPMRASHSEPSLVPPSQVVTPPLPPRCETPIGMTVESETSPCLKPEDACRNDFQDHVRSSLFNLSRVITLFGLQFHETLRTDNKEILTSVLATIYELPTIVSEGDFHIFINTVFFGNTKYIIRYDVSLSLTQQSKFSLKEDGYPNMLCRLFTHWSSDVRDYLHKLIVFRIMTRRKEGLTDLELLLIDTFAQACRECSYHFDVFWDHDDYEHAQLIDYELLGKTIVALLRVSIDGSTLRRQNLPNQIFNDYIARLATETDLYLYLLLINQDSSDYHLLYNQSVAPYFFDSVGRFCELLYRVHTDPLNTKAPPVLNMVFSNFGGVL